MTTPPPEIQAIADAYECGHCPDAPASPILDRNGTWHLFIWHDDTCPVHLGTVSYEPDLHRAETAQR